MRDYRLDVSYKLGFLFRVLSAVLNVGIYYFIARVFNANAAPYLNAYGGSYFAFVILGWLLASICRLG